LNASEFVLQILLGIIAGVISGFSAKKLLKHIEKRRKVKNAK
jgi:NhaP-type Na+/H+ or K+/H+ antiporter